VVFSPPDAPRSRLVKRLVAVGPARVELRGGQLYIDGVRDDPPQGPAEKVELPDRGWDLRPGQYFVVGDNRANSYDSRDFGPISEDNLRGILRLGEP
jgi:signal peptidase I